MPSKVGLCILAFLWPILYITSVAAARQSDFMRLLSYSEINSGLADLGRKNSRYLRVHSASQTFPFIPTSPHLCTHLSHNDAPCKTLFADFNSAKSGSPTVLILGPLHGDEPVAATAAYNLAVLLVSRAEEDPWISHLLSTRRIVLVPLPASAAYSAGTKLETLADGTSIDPATDFPFARDATLPDACLQSTGASLVDALFRSHTFVTALHLRDSTKGQESVTFSWGSNQTIMCSGHHPEPNNGAIGDYLGRIYRNGNDHVQQPCPSSFASPDDRAMRAIAKRMAAFAGPSHEAGLELAVGAQNEIGTPSPGGFLDYAYASSARGEFLSHCATHVRETSHRAATFIVQAAQSGAGEGRETLGRLSQLYQHERSGNTITRVLRAALAGIDLAAPYLFWLSADEDEPVEARGGIAHVRWSVGGAVSVTETWLSCRLGEGESATEWTTQKQTGGSMWSQSFEDSTGLRFFRLNTLASASYEFRHSLQLFLRMTPSQRAHGTRLFLRAEAVVDSDWLPTGASLVFPTTHLVQLRSNNSWQAVDSDGQPMRGRKSVSTETLVVEVPPVSGFAAFLHFVWEFLVLAAFLCIAPPAGLILCTRRGGNGGGSGSVSTSSTTAVVRQRLRRTWRHLTQGELINEVARARGTKPGFRRNVSVTNLLGAFTPSSSALQIPKDA